MLILQSKIIDEAFNYIYLWGDLVWVSTYASFISEYYLIIFLQNFIISKIRIFKFDCASLSALQDLCFK